MRAFQVTEFGSPPVLRACPAPKPQTGEVLIDIKACGLNFADLLMQDGRYQDTPEPPFTLGMELAGMVQALGAGVTGLSVGAHVAVFGGHGGLADQGCFPVDRVLALPPQMPFTDAAALQIAYGTSHLALTRRAQLQAGETLLVLGAAGGVGLTAVEIGKALGARVIACARGADKLAIARAAGADHVIDSATTDLRDAVKDLGGADVVYDPVGGALFDSAFRACNPEARLLTIGFASGTVPQIPANHLLVKNLSVMGFYWGGYLRFKPDLVHQSLRTLLSWYEDGRIKPHISHTFPLDGAAEGLALLRERKSTGKIVITV